MMQDILLKTKPLPAQQIVTRISRALLICFISDNVQIALFYELKTENGEIVTIYSDLKEKGEVSRIK